VSFLVLAWLWLLLGLSQNLSLIARYIVHTNKAFILVDQKKAEGIRSTTLTTFQTELQNRLAEEFSSPYAQKVLLKLPQLNDFGRHRRSVKSPAICQIAIAQITPNHGTDLLQKICPHQDRTRVKP
jgi:hypothetical protein